MLRRIFKITSRRYASLFLRSLRPCIDAWLLLTTALLASCKNALFIIRSWNPDHYVIARAPSYSIGYDTYPNTILILSLGLGDQIID